MVAGTRIIRTSVASMKIAAANPRPNSLITRSPPNTNDPNTHTMIAAAAVMTRAVCARPSATASPLSCVLSNSSLIRLNRKIS